MPFHQKIFVYVKGPTKLTKASYLSNYIPTLYPTYHLSTWVSNSLYRSEFWNFPPESISNRIQSSDRIFENLLYLHLRIQMSALLCYFSLFGSNPTERYVPNTVLDSKSGFGYRLRPKKGHALWTLFSFATHGFLK